MSLLSAVATSAMTPARHHAIPPISTPLGTAPTEGVNASHAYQTTQAGSTRSGATTTLRFHLIGTPDLMRLELTGDPRITLHFGLTSAWEAWA